MKKLYFLFAALFMAAVSNAQTTGKAGPNATWTLTDDGVLTISGKGVMVNDQGYLGYRDSYSNTISKITKVVIEEGITAICESAFSGCVNVTEISIPKTISRVDREAFCDCRSLESFTFPQYCTVKALGKFAFAGCTNLKNVKLPIILQSISIGCFKNCQSLDSIIIPDFVTTIEGGNSEIFVSEDGAFAGCRSLEKINFGKGLKVIGSSAFRNCHSLRKVEFPSNISYIGNYAFGNCAALERVIINSSLEMDYNSFDDCPSLKYAIIYGNPKSCKAITNNPNITLLMPAGYQGSVYTLNTATYKYEKTAKCELVFFYAVTTMPNAYGEIKVDTKWAIKGKKVNITVTPKDGYECTQLVLNKGLLDYVAPGQKKKLKKNKANAFILPDKTFTMPDYNCTITGFFEPKH